MKYGATRQGQSGPSEQGLEVAIMRAGDGDCVLIRCLDSEENFNILVDGGRAATVKCLKAYLDSLAPQERMIDLFVLTHVDADHIEGALQIACDDDLKGLVREVWFNDAKRCAAVGAIDLSTKQGDEFTTLIGTCGWKWNTRFGGEAIMRARGTEVCEVARRTRLHLLGPTPRALRTLASVWPVDELLKMGIAATPPGSISLGDVAVPDVEALARSPHSEDTSATNGSSIAFVLEHGQQRILVAADSHAIDVVDALRQSFGSGPHHFDLAFLPHHGADANMSRDLAGLIAADRWAISTTGSRHHHPSPESLARVLKLRPSLHPTKLVFNSCHSEASVWHDAGLMRTYRYEVSLPPKNQPWVSLSIAALEPDAC